MERPAHARRRRPIVEEIEPRILYSADFVPAGLDAPAAIAETEQRTLDGYGEFDSSAWVDAQPRRHELVFVDTRALSQQELIDGLQQEPAANTAVLLTRWRERPEGARMTILAQEELPGIDEAGAALELAAAISSLALEPTLRRHQELIDKGELTEDERAELRELNVAMARSKGRP